MNTTSRPISMRRQAEIAALARRVTRQAAALERQGMAPEPALHRAVASVCREDAALLEEGRAW